MSASPTPRLRLYHYWRSSSSWRVRWAFALKGILCEWVAIDLLSGQSESEEHRKRNPLGFVPVLEFLDRPSSDPYRYLGESMAILHWTEETWPNPPLLPRDPLKRARARQLAEIINSDTQPLQNLAPTHHHSSDPAEQKAWMRHWTLQGLAAYESLIAPTAGLFSLGDELTIADLFLIPQCYNAKRQDVELSPFPRIERIFDHALQLPSCQASSPERFQPASIKG